jgi:hypothetical protein
MILYGLLLAGLLAALGGSYLTGRNQGIEAQKAEDTPMIQAAQAERAVAVQANEGLQRDLAGIRTEVDSCNTKVAQLKEDSDQAIENMNLIIKESDERKKIMQQTLARFQAAARPVTPVAPDLQCQAARATLSELSDQMAAIDALGLSKPASPPGRVTVTPVRPK